MRLLLDTHALLWWSEDDLRLGGSARRRLTDGADDILVSPVSAYEMTFKHLLGKLPSATALLADLDGYLKEQGFAILPIEWRHAELAGRLPLEHRDPFDRLLIAQAVAEDLTLMSNDTAFDQFGVRRLW